MEHIKKFETINEFVSENPNLPYPCVSYVVEADSVVYKELHYITAKYRITQDIIYNAENDEIELFKGGAKLHSYSINGEKYGPFEEPKYSEPIHTQVTYDYVTKDGFNGYVASLNSAIECGANLFNTEITWSIDREFNENDIFYWTNYYYLTGDIDGIYMCPISEAINEGVITINEDTKSFNLTQDFCDFLNSKYNKGYYTTFSIVTINDIYEESNDLLKNNPNTITTFTKKELLNVDKTSPTSITIPCTQDDLDKEYEVKYFLDPLENKTGVYGNSLYEIDFSKLYNYKLYEISDYAFEYNILLTTIDLSNFKTIGANSFYNCINLSEINFGVNIKSIGGSAFSDCYNLTYVDADGINYIGDSAFSDCPNLQRVSISSSHENENTSIIIGSRAFADCYSLERVDVQGYEISIKYGSFYSCSALTHCVMDASLITEIGNFAFFSCHHLEYILNNNNTCEYIGENAFYMCSSLKYFNIPNTCTSIGDYAFQYCSSLTSITIPSSITYLGKYSFANLQKVNSLDITLNENVTYIGSLCFNNTKLNTLYLNCDLFNTNMSEQTAYQISPLVNMTANKIILGENISNIGANTFLRVYTKEVEINSPNMTKISKNAFSASGIEKITICEGIETIEEEAFAMSRNLKYVTLPSTLTTISSNAFLYNTALTEIKCHALIAPTIEPNTFNSLYRGGNYQVLYHPKGSDYSSWMSTEPYYLGYYGWKDVEFEIESEE